MAKRFDYSTIKRPNQPYIVNDHGETDTHWGAIKVRHRTDIQRNNPDLLPSAVEALLAKRMARGYRPYRPSS
ncbi:hypothetical protein [Sphingomonas pseudosanguinis]|uniref:Uncharacterized protein n=1 Tax=Sphingomonas pseudosanguinis TaxID=413712 RepID=A0A7W6F530_9SPHN|nr:hypothetical protein [Sphingomonas pseudosanguinis]MBB3881115.1 hypothetical protein [Sphingomonas pseudosanguinis]MBN3535884.1 hypothetical protein [Sphingomonas pseudosanguinis]